MASGVNLGTRICAISARKLAPSMVPSKTLGAVRPVTRSAARNVLVCHRAHGAWSWTRAPRRARPDRRRRLFVMPVSSRKTKRVGSQVGASAPHDPRGRDVRSIVFGGPARFFCWSRPGPPPRARSSPDWPACRGCARAMRQRIELHAFVVRQNQRDLRASSCHTRLLVACTSTTGQRQLFHNLNGQDTRSAHSQVAAGHPQFAPVMSCSRSDEIAMRFAGGKSTEYSPT